MSDKIIYVGVDVDDNSFTGAAFVQNSGELLEFKARPTAAALDKKIREIAAKYPSYSLKICYEATYLGFSLQRELVHLGHHCEVIAPSSIPRQHSNNVKTDRIDAGKLANYYANNLLSIVHPPDPEAEHDRELMRSRQFILKQLTEVRCHIQSLFRRNGKHFKKETQWKAHWTSWHRSWIQKNIEESSGTFKFTLSTLVQQMHTLESTLKEIEQKVDELAQSEKYKKQVLALTCYRGIKNIWAMVMITEIGNIKRFDHPRRLVGFMGLDLREYSSGGKEHKFGITKAGNKYLRTAFAEANQRSWQGTTISQALKQRRELSPTPFVDIAIRCSKRLYRKGYKMQQAGKNGNKIKIACAREMIGFVWESLNLATAA